MIQRIEHLTSLAEIDQMLIRENKLLKVVISGKNHDKKPCVLVVTFKPNPSDGFYIIDDEQYVELDCES